MTWIAVTHSLAWAAEAQHSAKGRNMIAVKPHHFVDIVTAFGDGCTEFQPHPYGHAVHMRPS